MPVVHEPRVTQRSIPCPHFMPHTFSDRSCVNALPRICMVYRFAYMRCHLFGRHGVQVLPTCAAIFLPLCPILNELGIGLACTHPITLTDWFSLTTLLQAL
eukprot:GHUV01017998.1.p3 GENE.GHUV01017998.1~~GHUV01017998.1.p3  ORF type:complete len:101 (+),score=2.33 GHUV01017998.1:128-430(+)